MRMIAPPWPSKAGSDSSRARKGKIRPVMCLDRYIRTTEYTKHEIDVEASFKVNHEYAVMGSADPSRRAYRYGRAMEVLQFRASRAFLEHDSARSLARVKCV